MALFPELGPFDQLALALIGQEYKVRQCWGDRPSHADYAARFAKHGFPLGVLLRASMPAWLPSSVQRDRLPKAATPYLLWQSWWTCLGSMGCSGAAQRQDMNLTRFAEPRGLASELIKRGWLTAYQVNQFCKAVART